MLAACQAWDAPPALGEPPEVVDRAVHDHAVGHHQRFDREVARRGVRRRWPVRLRRLAGRRRGHRPGADQRRAGGRTAGRRDPRRPVDRAVVGAGVPPHRRHRHRLGRDDEPRRDRVPRVRPARGHRYGVRHQGDQDRHADPGRRQQRGGHDPRETDTVGAGGPRTSVRRPPATLHTRGRGVAGGPADDGHQGAAGAAGLQLRPAGARRVGAGPQLGMGKSSVHRILSTLLEGFVAKTHDDRYRLG